MTLRNRSGKRVKLARVTRNMGQAHLCDLLSDGHGISMSQNTLSNIENGRRVISDIELAGFAIIFNISPLWLLFDDHPPLLFDSHPLNEKRSH